MLKPGDEFYEEARFEFNEFLQTLEQKQLISIVNSLLDQVGGFEEMTDSLGAASDEELQEIVSYDTEGE